VRRRSRNASGWRRWRRKTSSWSGDRCDVSDFTPAAADDPFSGSSRSPRRKLDRIAFASERAFLLQTAFGLLRECAGTAAAVMRLRTRVITNLVDPARFARRGLRNGAATGRFWTMSRGNSIAASKLFVLFELEGLSTPKSRALLAIPVGTVASRLRRARDLFSRGSQARPGAAGFP